jgi:nucleotide-binding universal stress UspA family protein
LDWCIWEKLLNILHRPEIGVSLYKKILVPIDGSAHSTRALEEAIKIAKTTNGTITLLTVQPSRPKILTAPKQPSGDDATKSIILAEGQKLVQAEGVFAETLLLEGNVVDQIVNAAKEGNFDLIVIGARGLSRFEEVLLGSISHGVVEKAPCPVIVTR